MSEFIKNVRLLIRGGADTEWESAGDQILRIGEIAYSTQASGSNAVSRNFKKDTATILKIGTGNKWSDTGANSSEEISDAYDNTVFYSGRGACILPPVQDETDLDPTLYGVPELGGVRLHGLDKPEYGLMVDSHGFLTLWRNNSGYTELHVHGLYADFISTENLEANYRVAGNTLTLREANVTYAEDGVTVSSITQLSDLAEGEIAGMMVRSTSSGDDVANLTYNYYPGIIMLYHPSETEGEEGTAEWGIGTSSDDFKPLATLTSTDDNELVEGPVVYNGANSFESWTPNSLTILVNSTNEYVYKPYTSANEETLDTIPITTIQQITINTVEYTSKDDTDDSETSDDEQEESQNVYTVAADGTLTIDLPVITNSKIADWDSAKTMAATNQFNITILEESITTINTALSSKVGSIIVNEQEIASEGSAYLIIKYEGTQLDIGTDNAINIVPYKYSFNGDSYINAASNDATAKDQTITISHKTSTITKNATSPYSFSSSATSLISGYNYSFDGAGHATAESPISLDVSDLYNKITTLVSALRALNNSSVNTILSNANL